MDRSAPLVPDRPGKTSFWTTARSAGRDDAPEHGAPSSTQPASVGVGSLDNVRAAFWQAFRHLFPPHSLAAQTPNGSVVISWSVMDDPHARYPYAAPVMLRFEPELLDAMRRSDPLERLRLARGYEDTLREGLRGYDPFARFPNARVVHLG
jgi:hypothetical protein